VILGLFMMDNVIVEGVSSDLYLSAAELGRDLELDPNDALAVEIMRRNEIEDIYSFDTDFDKVQGVKRLPPPPSD
jgi:predicted nucleic acid-binding protein